MTAGVVDPAGERDAHTAAADEWLTDRARTTADVIAGLIVSGMLHHVGRPQRLPELMFPHLDPQHVRQVWDAAAVVGYLAGRQQSRSRWETTGLDDAATLLHAAGFEAMGRCVRATAHAAPSRPIEPTAAVGDGDGTAGWQA